MMCETRVGSGAYSIVILPVPFGSRGVGVPHLTLSIAQDVSESVDQ